MDPKDRKALLWAWWSLALVAVLATLWAFRWQPMPNGARFNRWTGVVEKWDPMERKFHVVVPERTWKDYPRNR